VIKAMMTILALNHTTQFRCINRRAITFPIIKQQYYQVTKMLTLHKYISELQNTVKFITTDKVLLFFQHCPSQR